MQRSESSPGSHEVTRILSALSGGDGAAAAELMPLVYDELRALAGSWFRGHSRSHTLQPTALVNEAYLKLVGQVEVKWSGRAHFFAVAAKAMRQILIDHARRSRAKKRSGGRPVTLDVAGAVGPRREIDVVEMDDAMRRLEELDPRMSQVVELRFFGGLTGAAAAAVLGVSRTTVDNDWRVARAWLRSELREKGA